MGTMSNFFKISRRYYGKKTLKIFYGVIALSLLICNFAHAEGWTCERRRGLSYFGNAYFSEYGQNWKDTSPKARKRCLELYDGTCGYGSGGVVQSNETYKYVCNCKYTTHLTRNFLGYGDTRAAASQDSERQYQEWKREYDGVTTHQSGTCWPN